ncbi:TetR/AcrR family transcriptional regulator [Nitrospirillum pindoramense]|uniref:TetR family transcriptional regulator n=1 Tax=Nitrospirillum amazonense TaxID=28077 RepID=A0A560HBF6_9PROT|nr:TetR/AcrR family transcriptional regulator [Nitrospirillum amazonense]TWB43441.1 TetR family transcriptional regulator [Nitrospirillum amazonense]
MPSRPIDATPMPDLSKKQTPVQKRSIDTVETILSAAALLLGEVGIERLSTNLICARAGLTPPALYRYFPNKYAVLKELGVRMMERMNAAYIAWVKASHPMPTQDTPEQQADRLRQIQEVTNDIARNCLGGVWVLRALRAVPALQQLRLESHNFVAERSFQEIRGHYPHTSDTELRLATRLAVEVMYSATEMVFDEPGLDDNLINREIADMVVRYFAKFAEREAALAAAN